MPKFYYTVKGTADETANAIGVVDAADQDEALTKLNSTYGNTEDNQLVEINFISDAFNKLEAERGNELTHKVE